MNLFIDIHSHLDVEELDDRRDTLIENAEKAGVKVILTNGIDSSSNKETLALAKKYEIVKACLGIYPGKVMDVDIDKEIGLIRKHKKDIVAIGEVGLDGLDKTHFRQQQETFQKMIDLAKELDLPIIVHSRKAEKEAVEMLQTSKIKKVLLHCFCGKKNLIKRAEDIGYYFSVPTNVVRAENFQSMARNVSINRLFAETDSPWLTPFKHKRNQPAFVLESYKEIAKQKGMTLEEVEKNIWMNWQRLF